MGKNEHGLHFKCSYYIILDIITVLCAKKKKKKGPYLSEIHTKIFVGEMI